MKHTKKRKYALSLLGQMVAFILVLSVMLMACGGPKPGETTGTTTEETTTGETTGETTEETTVPDEVRTLKPNPYQADDFQREGEMIHCTAARSVVGIDVSRYQGNIDWAKVRDAGIDYVIIRAGFRGYGTSGSMGTDANVEKYYLGARAAGLKVGFYFFSQATTPQEGIEEAQYVLDLVRGWQVDMPIVCDWEYAAGYRVYGMTMESATACVKAFCDTVEAAGYQSMFYCTKKTAGIQLDLEVLCQYGIWYADYEPFLGFPYQVDMWQYTDTGRVPGISGKVDMNVIFLEDTIFDMQ